MYNVNEIFETIQGEGVFTGVPAVFIRLQGCPVACSWCDTRQTWDASPQEKAHFSAILEKRADSATWASVTTADIVNHLTRQFSAKHVVITGGEPCIFDLLPLTAALETNGYRCQIETSGTYPISASSNTWVTVSPKINMRSKLLILDSAIARADEIKHPVATESDIDKLDAILATVDTTKKIIALQPISQKPNATALCIKTCIERNWRLSIQTHKYLNIA